MTDRPADRARPISKLRGEQRGGIRRDACAEPPPAELLLAIRQFNAGEYWEVHETLEEIWIREPRDIRYLYQGILLVAVGLLHLERRNRHGAVTKLTSGLALLTPFAPSCMTVDVAGLRRDAQTFVDALAENPEHLDPALALARPVCRSVAR